MAKSEKKVKKLSKKELEKLKLKKAKKVAAKKEKKQDKKKKAKKKKSKKEKAKEVKFSSVRNQKVFVFRNKKYVKVEDFIKYLNNHYLEIDKISQEVLDDEKFYGWLSKKSGVFDESIKQFKEIK